MNVSTHAADFLLELRSEKRKELDIPEWWKPQDFPEAYRIQRLLVDKLTQCHEAVLIGYKAACTNESAQAALNLDSPFFGCLLSSSTKASPARIETGQFAFCCIEAEFAFQMGEDVSPSKTPYTAETVTDYVEAILPAIEIVNSFYTDWTKVGAHALAADNAIHGAWIPGSPATDWRDLDLASHSVELIVNGEVIRTGSGAAVLGNPLNVLAWLANELPNHDRMLQAGDFVTTGLTTEIYLGEAGDRIRADFGSLGIVELELLGDAR